MTTTSNALDGLLYIRNGYSSVRWNFPDAVGSPVGSLAGVGNAVALTYSFLAATPSYFSAPSFLAFNEVQKQAARDVLSSIAEVAGIHFVEASGVGQITLAMSSQASGQSGYAYSPNYAYSYSGTSIVSVTEQEVAGDVWLNRDANWAAEGWLPGQEGYSTLLHEIGHALGLKHPFESTGSGFLLVSSLDDESHTVMSYSQAPHSRLISVSGTPMSYSWHETFIGPSTLMPLDIEALQYLYGADTTTRTGNDVYQWPNKAELLETIWDAGGVDTLDCSNQSLTCIIDLRPGQYSSIALRQTDAELRLGLELPDWFSQPLPADTYNGSNNLAIASGTLIEKALGGDGDDQITGNDANNTLNGGAGADTLIGGDGSDTYYVDNAGDIVTETNATASTGGIDVVQSSLAAYTLSANVENGRIRLTTAANLTGNSLDNILYAGVGNNVLDGGAGIDTVSYAYGITGATGVTIDLRLATAQVTGGSGSDTLKSVEKLIGSANNDSLIGSSAANRLEGGAGNDSLNGYTGADTLIGGDGSDTYYVDNVGDIVTETNGTASTGGVDVVQSSLAAYTLSANVENGRIRLTTAANLTGNSLNNILYAGAGNNLLDGVSGVDTVSYLYATAAVSVSLATSAAQATGGSGSDTLKNIDKLTGSNFHDTLIGDANANTLDGLALNDALSGGGGNDTLIGGLGKDSLTGGAGNDTFTFKAIGETTTSSTTCDVITDFVRGQDKIDLSAIDANTATASVNDAFTAFLGSSMAFSAAGQLRLTGNVLYGNIDADSAAEFAIVLTGITQLAIADVVL